MGSLSLQNNIKNALPDFLGGAFLYYFKKSSSRKTTAQEATDTISRLPPFHAISTPITSAASPDHTLPVASNIAGKVIIVRVT